MPKISIIVPVYNIENYIERCIDSIIGQTYDNLEVILVDDGSTDKSGLVCDEYAQKDSRVKVIHKENGGLSSARNCGLDNAHGDFIMFVDGDDYISKSMCRILYSSIVENDSDMAVCSINNIDENGNAIDFLNDDDPLRDRVMSKTEFQDALIHKGNWYYSVAWNKLYKAEILKDVRYPLNHIHEDEFVIHHIIDNCKTISTVTDRLYNYISHSTSITHKKYNIRRLDIMTALTDRVMFYIKTEASRDVITTTAVENVKTLYITYMRSDMNEAGVKDRYCQIEKELKKAIRAVLRYRMRISYRLFLTANLISPRLV